jgi:hypothetical protein
MKTIRRRRSTLDSPTAGEVSKASPRGTFAKRPTGLCIVGLFAEGAQTNPDAALSPRVGRLVRNGYEMTVVAAPAAIDAARGDFSPSSSRSHRDRTRHKSLTGETP